MKIKLNLFFRSFFLSFVIFALVSGIIMTKLYIDVVAIDPANKESNVLIGVTNGDKLISLAVINLNPEGNCISFLPIPDNTLISNGKVLQSLYENNGISNIKNAIEGLIGTTIDRYILFSTRAISALTDSVGIVNCYIYNPFLYNGTYYSGQRSMNGELAEAMFTYDGYDMTKVSLSEIGRSYMEGFLSDHAKPQTVSGIASTVNSESFRKLIDTDLSGKEVLAYCDFLAKYELFSHKFIELPGYSTTTSSSIYFTPDNTNSTQNIFE